MKGTIGTDLALLVIATLLWRALFPHYATEEETLRAIVGWVALAAVIWIFEAIFPPSYKRRRDQ